MAKNTITPKEVIKKVSCSGCKYNIPSDHQAIIWCDKIKMPRPSAELNQCIYKILK